MASEGMWDQYRTLGGEDKSIERDSGWREELVVVLGFARLRCCAVRSFKTRISGASLSPGNEVMVAVNSWVNYPPSVWSFKTKDLADDFSQAEL